jgi:hypothetical protein
MSLTKASYSMITGAPVNVLDYGADPTGVNVSTTAFANALAAVPSYGSLYIPAGTYLGVISIRRNNITIFGDGSASTLIKTPSSVDSITLELGNTAAGNSAPAYTNINVSGLTLDGNYANVPTPSTDLTGHAFIATNCSYCTWTDLVCQNAQTTCMDVVINSNYNHIEATCINGGNGNIPVVGYYPNFDINSSKYNICKVVSINGKYGGRLLDNCWGNIVDITVNNPSYTGYVYSNQTVNKSYSNTITANILNGCTYGQGMSVGSNCYNSTITANISNVVGQGFYVNGASGYSPSGNTFNVRTYQCGGAGVYDGQYSNYNTYNINSKADGYGSSSGSVFQVDVNGSYNQFEVNILGIPGAEIARGFVFRSTAANNQIVNLVYDPNLVQTINDLGTNNYTTFALGVPPSVASANTIYIPYAGSLINVTGTTNIYSIGDPVNNQGRTITLLFAAALTVQSLSGSGGNIQLANSSNFTVAAGYTLTLISNGTNWYEVSRALT